MKNMETWKFAHEYCGKLWWKAGWGMLALSILIQVPFVHSSEDMVGVAGGILCTVQTAVLAASVIPTEIALKRTFTEGGERK